MPLVSMKEMLLKAKQGKYAVGQFNINNLEWTSAILETAQENNAPVILGVSTGAAKYMGGYNTVVHMVRGLMIDKGITVPVAIHLDHGPDFAQCKAAIDAGFTSVMIDGSHHPFLENAAITKEVVDYAHMRGVSVEAELGTVGGQEDDVIGESIIYANPKECEALVNESGLDALAPALGSVHGPYAGEPNLGFKEMAEINELVPVPLVLHGGSGIPDEQIARAISCGTAKINVNTECQQVFQVAVIKQLADKPAEYDPRKIIGPGKAAIKDIVKTKMVLFGCVNKA